MILSANNISKQFNENYVLKGVSFLLNDYDKAALVGINGSGKTTLLRIIAGESTPDDGLITLAKDKSFGYLPQNAIIDSDQSIFDEVLSVKKRLLNEEAALRDMESQMGTLSGEELDSFILKYNSRMDSFIRDGGDMINSEVTGALIGLGFSKEDWNKPVNTLSGGQKTRVALCKLLVGRPDLIILDEPTNHLDMNSIIWLEGYLKNYKGTVLIVSHDRFFLDRIADKILDLENGHLDVYTGSYTEYAAKKEQRRISKLNEYLKYKADVEHQQAVIDKLKSFNREKSIRRAESRQKMLDKIEVVEKPVDIDNQMKIVLEPLIESGKDVLEVTELTKSYGNNLLFKDINLSLKKGDHVAIIGDNGTGKTTILKILNELVDADSGSFRLGSNVTIGYYDQEHHVLHDEKTLFDEISDEYPTLSNTEIRNVLAAFLFTDEDVFKTIATLSGGEKGRVSLAKLMLSEANLLILDEPTNHLDIASKEILEDAINNYTGTVLYVSHDRYFINRTADRIYELSNGSLAEYLGNYDYYLFKKEQLSTSTALKSNNHSTDNTEVSKNALDYKAGKEAAAAARKLAKEIDRIETRITELEDKNKELEVQMCDPVNVSNSVLLQSLQKEIDDNNDELLELMDRWEEISS